MASAAKKMAPLPSPPLGTMSVDGSALLMPTSAKQLLRDDDSLLRQMFFNVLRHHHPNTATKVRVRLCVCVCVQLGVGRSLRSRRW
jgi:hypothetical protein